MVAVDGSRLSDPGVGARRGGSSRRRPPFAVITWFKPETEVSIAPVGSFSDLEARCDEFRRSGDIFSAPRLGWHFKRVSTRAVNPPRPGTRFVDAAKAQSESTFADIDGSLVGLFRNSA